MNGNDMKKFASMPEVYCALHSKVFLSGEFSAMSPQKQEQYLEQNHKIHTYNAQMEKIQNNDIFRRNMTI